MITFTEETVITTKAMLDHWQGHRRLTRKMIEAFPENSLFGYSAGGMRPFSDMVIELIDISAYGILGILTGKWKDIDDMEHHTATSGPITKAEILDRWDEVTDDIDILWPRISPSRFLENDTAFGRYEMPIYSTLLYFIDNEIHHRGQGYVYLRMLGIEPPPFWER
jgi:uncharacterized damage-inducible protein DinB